MPRKPGLIPGSDQKDTIVENTIPGVKGVFAQNPGFTPKYAVNKRGAGVGNNGKETLARMFMSMSDSDYNAFIESGALDTRTAQVFDTLKQKVAGNEVGGDFSTIIGYMNFFLTSATHGYREKVQIDEVLSDNYVAHFFGQEAPIWSYSGILLNTWQDDWLPNFLRLYSSVLRGTKLASLNNVIRLKYDSLVVSGTLLGFNWELSGANEMLIPFGFQLLVKDVTIETTYDPKMGGRDITIPLETEVPTSSYRLLEEQDVPYPVRLGAAAAPPSAIERPAGLSTTPQDTGGNFFGKEEPFADYNLAGIDFGDPTDVLDDAGNVNFTPAPPVNNSTVTEQLPPQLPGESREEYFDRIGV